MALSSSSAIGTGEIGDDSCSSDTEPIINTSLAANITATTTMTTTSSSHGV
ncbi:hypothetical protein RDWZM_004471, partial [Blomia tropicalis]